MAAHFWWSWSVGLPSTAYNNSGFVLSSTGNISTNNTTTLFVPSPGSLSPSEEFHLTITANQTLKTPLFQNGAVTAGWLVFRFKPGTFSGTAMPIVKIQSGSSSIVELRHLTADLATQYFTPSIHVNGALVGTAETFPSENALYVMAIDFDLGAAQPEAGLVINGKRQVVRDNSGAGSATTMNNVEFNSGATTGVTSIFGDIAVFNALADLTDRSSQDVWVTFLDPDAATDGDNSWTPSSGTDLTAVNDASATTFTQTVTSPDTITYGFESCNTRSSGWSPTKVYGLATFAYASASATQTNTTLALVDNVPATVSSTNVTLTTTNTFMGVWTAVDSAAAAWTPTSINASTAIYSVA